MTPAHASSWANPSGQASRRSYRETRQKVCADDRRGQGLLWCRSFRNVETRAPMANGADVNAVSVPDFHAGATIWILAPGHCPCRPLRHRRPHGRQTAGAPPPEDLATVDSVRGTHETAHTPARRDGTGHGDRGQPSMLCEGNSSRWSCDTTLDCRRRLAAKHCKDDRSDVGRLSVGRYPTRPCPIRRCALRRGGNDRS